MSPFPPLDDACIVFRAVTRPSGIRKQTGEIRLSTFMRRGPDANGRPRDVHGLSVNFRAIIDLTNPAVSAIIVLWKP
jgi:hypothetical protein